MNIIEGKLNLDSNTKIAIINARFNHIITDRLVEGAKDAFFKTRRQRGKSKPYTCSWCF